MNPAYRTSTVTALAARIRDERAYHLLPIIADALQDAGCYEPLLENLRAGLPVAEAAGYLVPDGWWEYARLGEELAAVQDRLDQTPVRIGAKAIRKGSREANAIVTRRAELLRLHTGACPTCANTGYKATSTIYETGGALLTIEDCPTCPTRERWDRAKCPECKGPRERHNTQWYPCRTCGGSGDPLVRWANGGTMGYYADERRLSFDGPLPLVSARVEEIAEEVDCEKCGGHGGDVSWTCRSCSGAGRIVRPTAWLRSLPVWYEVDVEGVEPVHSRFPGEENEDGFTWWRDSEYRGDRSFASQGLLPDWIWDRLPGEARASVHSRQYFRYPSPAAARQALVAAVRRWRCSPRVDLT